MSKLRKILFLAFVAVYGVIAPLTVLYALGYIFNPVEQTLTPTGLISLNSQPSGAKVRVNGVLFKSETPVVVRNLESGIHEIEVDLEGRHPWRRQIKVEAERAVRFENILLFPLSFQMEILSDFPVLKMAHSPGGKYLFTLSEDRRASGLYFFDLENQKLRPVFSRVRDPKMLVKSLHLHPEGNRALIAFQKGDSAPFYFVKLTHKPRVRNLTGYLEEAASQNLAWSQEDKNSFFYLQEGTLKRFNADRGILYPAIAQDILGYTVHEGELFFLDRNFRFYEASEKGKIRETLLEADTKARLIFGDDSKNAYSIFFLAPSFPFSLRENAITIFLSEKGRLVSNRLPYVLDEKVEEVAFAESHARMAYRKGDELWVVDFDQPRRKSFFEAGPEPRLIYRGSRVRSPLVWFYEDQYVLFLEENSLRAQDFEGGEALPLFEISRKNNDFVLHEDYVYFSEPEKSRLARIKLFEKSWLLSQWTEPLPETPAQKI